MRTFELSPADFERSDSEESLSIRTARVDEHESPTAFLSACGVFETGSRAPAHWGRWSWVCEYAWRFARLSLPALEACEEANVTCDAWDEVEVWVTTSECRVWFRWRTSA